MSDLSHHEKKAIKKAVTKAVAGSKFTATFDHDEIPFSVSEVWTSAQTYVY